MPGCCRRPRRHRTNPPNTCVHFPLTTPPPRQRRCPPCQRRRVLRQHHACPNGIHTDPGCSGLLPPAARRAAGPVIRRRRSQPGRWPLRLLPGPTIAMHGAWSQAYRSATAADLIEVEVVRSAPAGGRTRAATNASRRLPSDQQLPPWDQQLRRLRQHRPSSTSCTSAGDDRPPGSPSSTRSRYPGARPRRGRPTAAGSCGPSRSSRRISGPGRRDKN